MFVGDEVLLLDVAFASARARLVQLARGGSLLPVSAEAYHGGFSGLFPSGKPTAAPGLSRLVQVQFRDLTERNNSAAFALRWEAIGSGGLLPVLDADITLSQSGLQATLLALAGVYRPPPGSRGAEFDDAILRRVAAATIRNFIDLVAACITGRAATTGSESAGPGPA